MIQLICRLVVGGGGHRRGRMDTLPWVVWFGPGGAPASGFITGVVWEGDVSALKYKVCELRILRWCICYFDMLQTHKCFIASTWATCCCNSVVNGAFMFQVFFFLFYKRWSLCCIVCQFFWAWHGKSEFAAHKQKISTWPCLKWRW
jgi:hypothetical protein